LARRAIQERERANQERERQKMIESIEQDYIQRLELLGSQLDNAESDLKRHKSLLDEQNNKTKENEEKIAEVSGTSL
jgi:hypothetical protein